MVYGWVFRADFHLEDLSKKLLNPHPQTGGQEMA